MSKFMSRIFSKRASHSIYEKDVYKWIQVSWRLERYLARIFLYIVNRKVEENAVEASNSGGKFRLGAAENAGPTRFLWGKLDGLENI